MRWRDCVGRFFLAATIGCGGASPPASTTNEVAVARCAETAPPAWASLVRALDARVCAVTGESIEMEVHGVELEREAGPVDAYASGVNWIARDVWLEDPGPPAILTRSYVDGSRALSFEMRAASDSLVVVRVAVVDPATLPPESPADDPNEADACEQGDDETAEAYAARCPGR